MLTETYSPAAMLSAPATRPATPAIRMVVRPLVAPAAPITMPAVETMPSLAPRTPARSQLSRAVDALLVRLVLVRPDRYVERAGVGGHGVIVRPAYVPPQAR